MNSNSVTSHHDNALQRLDAARELVDLIGSLNEERRALGGVTDVDVHRGHVLRQMIGEANAQLGFALKSADVYATLDVAEATREATAYAKRTDGYDSPSPLDPTEVHTLSGEQL